MSGFRLRSYEFRKEREASWRRLQTLVNRVETRGLRSLSGAELAELPQLYRGALSALSVARAISLDRNLLEFLESLCQRAYLAVYASRRHAWDVVANYFLRQLPQAVRKFRWHLFTAFLFLAVGIAAGYLVTVNDPEKFYAFVDEGLAGARGPERSQAEMHRSLYGDESIAASDAGHFAGHLFQNNAGLAIICFALGFAAGLPVFWFMISTGLMVGAFVGVYHPFGLELDMIAWLSIHGVTELLAILIAAAGGLALAHALVFPGEFSRLESLARAGRQAGLLIVGGVLMLFVAGLLEGFARAWVNDMHARFVVAGITAVIWFAYFTFAGRGRPA